MADEKSQLVLISWDKLLLVCTQITAPLGVPVLDTPPPWITKNLQPNNHMGY